MPTQLFTLPAALLVANTSLVWSEVQYTYTPTIGYVISGSLLLKDQIVYSWRMMLQRAAERA